MKESKMITMLFDDTLKNETWKKERTNFGQGKVNVIESPPLKIDNKIVYFSILEESTLFHHVYLNIVGEPFKRYVIFRLTKRGRLVSQLKRKFFSVLETDKVMNYLSEKEKKRIDSITTSEIELNSKKDLHEKEAISAPLEKKEDDSKYMIFDTEAPRGYIPGMREDIDSLLWFDEGDDSLPKNKKPEPPSMRITK